MGEFDGYKRFLFDLAAEHHQPDPYAMAGQVASDVLTEWQGWFKARSQEHREARRMAESKSKSKR